MSGYYRHHSVSPVADEFEFRYENRNSEENHNAALAEAYEEHNEIREAAIRANELHKLKRKQKKRRLQIAQVEERVRVLEEQAREQARVQELENRERQAAITPAPPPSQPSVQSPQPPSLPTIQPTPAAAQVAATQFQTQPTHPTQSTPHPANPFQPTTQPPTPFQHTPTSQPQPTHVVNPFQPTPTSQPQAAQPSSPLQPTPTAQAQATQPVNPFAQTATPSSNPLPPAAALATSAHQPVAQTISISPTTGEHHLHGTERYVEIHKQLKGLRQYVNAACAENKEFKKSVGELRRGLRAPIGQFVVDKSKNREPAKKLFHVLEQSLNSVPSPGVDPSIFMVDKADPVEGAKNNGEKLPALFIYLLNYLAKYVVQQLISEASVKPEIADAIGVVTVQIFSRAEFLWRGKSMIDILMAKMRISCPVLFGIRGSEKTEQGRARLGWKREKAQKGQVGEFVLENQHRSSMIGLASGYAAICLRDFSKAKAIKSPWHPSHYWQSLACIVATPPNQRSPTQYVVLKAMVEGYEDTFIKFYGAAAVATLTAVCVTFAVEAEAPDSAVPRKSSAVGGLEVLAERLFKEFGIRLRPY